MDSYTEFAKVYDLFMDNVPYEEWGTLLRSKLREYKVGKLPLRDENLKQEQNTVVDLCCGTGIMTQLLAKEGYDMIGIDLSEDMREVARERSRKETGEQDPESQKGSEKEKEKQILYLCQDMREFELFGTVGAVVCICDSLNYLIEEEDLLQTFRLVNNYLFPGGVFLFDFNTVHKYRDVIGDSVIAENREEASFIWENTYYEEEKINEYDLTFFVKEAAEGDAKEQPSIKKEKGTAGEGTPERREEEVRYRKFTETHVQRGYEPEEVADLLKQAGMLLLEMRDSDTGGAVTKDTERVFCVAGEQGKTLPPEAL